MGQSIDSSTFYLFIKNPCRFQLTYFIQIRPGLALYRQPRDNTRTRFNHTVANRFASATAITGN